MTPGVTTWEQIALSGNVLLVVNSTMDAREEVDAVMGRLRGAEGGALLHAIARPEWLDILTGHGIGRDQILPAADAEGQVLELNHFLEAPAAIHCSLSKRFSVIVGSAPHSLHNEEIKTPFEEGVALLSRDAMFLAHALPWRFLYVFDTPQFLERFSRERKRSQYTTRARAIVDDLHALWVSRGRPGPDDGDEATGASGAMMARLDSRLARYDEDGAPSLESARLSPDARACLLHLRDVVHDHVAQWETLTDEIARLNAVVDERNAAVASRDAINAQQAEERRQAVSKRDAIIDELRARLEPVHRKLWRLWKRYRKARA